MTLWTFVTSEPIFGIIATLVILLALYAVLSIALRLHCGFKSKRDKDYQRQNWISYIVEDKQNHSIILFLLGIVLFVSFVIFVFANYWGQGRLSNNIGDWGAVGDYFGGLLNPILAFASFMALLYTIRIQSEELRLARIEIQLSRVEAARSAAAGEKSSEAAASQLLLSKMQNDEKLFYKAIERVQQDVKTIKNSAFELEHYFSGNFSLSVGYVHVKKDKPRRYKFSYDNFVLLFLNKSGNIAFRVDGNKNVFRFGVLPNYDVNEYYLVGTSHSAELKDLLVSKFFIFERFFYSLSYVLHTISQMEHYYEKDRNFTPYYYSHLVDIIDEDFLVIIAILINHQRVIDHEVLEKFKFFERLTISKDGYIDNGPINVVNDLSLPDKSFGVNSGYLHEIRCAGQNGAVVA